MPVPTEFTPIASTIGGVLIGLSAVILMAVHGRIAGISGILGRLMPPSEGAEPGQAAAFVVGLLAAPLLYAAAAVPVVQTVSDTLPLMLAGGLLVGFGAAYGGGCTSGHGVCGVSRLSPGSLAATAVFMGTGLATVFIVRHVIGG